MWGNYCVTKLQDNAEPQFSLVAMAASRFPVRYRTIYDALNFLIKTNFVLGYSGFYKKNSRFKATREMLAYSIVMPWLVIVGLVLGTYNELSNPDFLVGMDKLLVSALLLEIAISLLTFCVNVSSMQSNRWRHIRLIDHIDELDAQLVRGFDVCMCYDKIAYKSYLILSVFFAYEAIVTLSVISQWSMGDLTAMIAIVCYSSILFGMDMATYSYMSVADIVRIRFRLLQKLIAPEYLRKHFADGEVRASKLRQAIEIYRGLYEVIDELNGVYGLCQLSSMAHDFTLTTIQLYLMFGRSSNLGSTGNLRTFIAVLSSLLPPAYKMVMMPVYSTMSMTEGKKCMRAIKLMDDAFPGDDRIRQIVGAALLWDTLNKVEYKIGPTIASNMGMMGVVISAIVNYVVIMIQFQIQEAVLTKEKEKVNFLQ